MRELRKQSRLFRLCTAIINGAALLAPKSSRADWKQEWMAEISCKLQVCDAWGRTDTMTQARLFYRSLGSFIDAFILRWDLLLSPLQTAPMGLEERQPLFLVLAFFALLILCQDIAVAWVLNSYGFCSIEYYQCYWVVETTKVFALLGILFLFCRCVLLGAARIWGGARLALGGLLVITCVLSAEHSRDFVRIWTGWIITFEMNVLLLCLLLSLTLLITVRRVESAKDLALPVYGLLILQAPLGIPFIGRAVLALCYKHYFYWMGLCRWVPNCCSVLAFVVWGYAYDRRTRNSPCAPSQTK